MKRLIILLCVTFLLISCEEEPKDLTKNQISAEYYDKLQTNSLVKIEESTNRYYLKIGDSIKEVADVSNTDIVSNNSIGITLLFFLSCMLVGSFITLSFIGGVY